MGGCWHCWTSGCCNNSGFVHPHIYIIYTRIYCDISWYIHGINGEILADHQNKITTQVSYIHPASPNLLRRFRFNPSQFRDWQYWNDKMYPVMLHEQALQASCPSIHLAPNTQQEEACYCAQRPGPRFPFPGLVLITNLVSTKTIQKLPKSTMTQHVWSFQPHTGFHWIHSTSQYLSASLVLSISPSFSPFLTLSASHIAVPHFH